MKLETKVHKAIHLVSLLINLRLIAKNKKTVYLLLALVLGIWGMIVYQFFGYSAASVENVSNQNFLLPPEITYIEPDTTLIMTDYRDPFSGKLEQKSKKSAMSVPNVSNAYTDKINSEKETIINYKGIVTDLNDKVKVFMVIIDGNTYLMRQGDEEGPVKLIKGTRETITVKHKGKLNTISIVQ